MIPASSRGVRRESAHKTPLWQRHGRWIGNDSTLPAFVERAFNNVCRRGHCRAAQLGLQTEALSIR
jgi:hypothetical protein